MYSTIYVVNKEYWGNKMEEANNSKSSTKKEEIIQQIESEEKTKILAEIDKCV